MSRSNAATDDEVFVYSGEGGAAAPQDVVRVRVDPSVTSIPALAFYPRKKLARWSCVKTSWKLGVDPSRIATIQLRISTSPTHSGGFAIMPSSIL
jgi:hypothetical protein